MPVSIDGEKIFVGSWERSYEGVKRGLRAYDTETGTLLWRLDEGKIRNIFVYQKYLIAAKALTCILKVDIESGAIMDCLKSGSVEHIFDLGFPYVLADTLSGKLGLVDIEKMIVVKKYSSKVVNPSDCLSLVIRDAYLKDAKLIISGFEEYPGRNFNASGNKTFDRVIDNWAL